MLQGEAEAKELNSGRGITMMFGLIDKDTPHLCHVGDSRYYLADHDQIQETKDMSQPSLSAFPAPKISTITVSRYLTAIRYCPAPRGFET